MTDSQALFDSLSPEFFELDDVAVGRIFGATGLAVRGKIFAFVSSDGDLIAKVPFERASELEGEGVAMRKTMGGRTMKEWVSVQPDDFPIWRDVMHEAHEYVNEITPR